jgi:hypothetical protein
MKKIYNIIKVYIYKKKKYIKAKNYKKIKKNNAAYVFIMITL